MPRKPMPWFRFYVEAVVDRKLRRLKVETRWLFVVCLAAARQSPEPGWLMVAEDDPMDWDDLVDFAHMTRTQVERGMDALQTAGIVSYDLARSAWHVPSWDDRQYESDDVTRRTRKHRAKGTSLERSKGVSGNDSGTPPETETETETESSSLSRSLRAVPMAVEAMGLIPGYESGGASA